MKKYFLLILFFARFCLADSQNVVPDSFLAVLSEDVSFIDSSGVKLTAKPGDCFPIKKEKAGLVSSTINGRQFYHLQYLSGLFFDAPIESVSEFLPLREDTLKRYTDSIKRIDQAFIDQNKATNDELTEKMRDLQEKIKELNLKEKQLQYQQERTKNAQSWDDILNNHK